MSGAPPDDRLYLHHILDAIARIESYLDGVDAPQFRTTPLLQDDVIRQLEIIGEAAKRLSESLREQTPSVPWRQIMGMRNNERSRCARFARLPLRGHPCASLRVAPGCRERLER